MPIKRTGNFDLAKEMEIRARKMISQFLSEEELLEVTIEINKTTSKLSFHAPDAIVEKITTNLAKLDQ